MAEMQCYKKNIVLNLYLEFKPKFGERQWTNREERVVAEREGIFYWYSKFYSNVIIFNYEYSFFILIVFLNLFLAKLVRRECGGGGVLYQIKVVSNSIGLFSGFLQSMLNTITEGQTSNIYRVAALLLMTSSWFAWTPRSFAYKHTNIKRGH